MTLPVVVDVVRTAAGRGKPGGALAHLHPVDLGAAVLAALLERNGLGSRQVDDVLLGCVSQTGEQGGNVARWAALAAGFDEAVPAATIDRQCGSSQQAVHFAAQGIAAGAYDIVIAGGVESMSRVPLGSSARGATDAAGLGARYPDGLVSQGVSADLVAARWGLDRDELDRYAAASHQRAAAHHPGPEVAVDGVAADETIRPATTAETLAGLAPAFRTDALAERFPDLAWHTTAGNSSPLTDAASAALIMSEETAVRLGLTPRARFVGYAVVGDDPLLMLTGVIPATRKVLDRTGLALDDIAAVEVNEAFASVPLAWQRELDADSATLNAWGGAIALGHAVGASGTRLLGTLLDRLEAGGGRYGLQTMCEGGGMANAMIVERLT